MRAILVGILMAMALTVVPQARLCAQESRERVDEEAIAKIKEEGLKRSQVMETISFLTDVHGPRLTGSPQTRMAAEWTTAKLSEWGLTNAKLEPWGPFGRGWTLDGFSANMVAPSYSPLIAYPKAWSPSTPKSVRGTPIYLDAATEKDLDQYQGKLHRAIVLFSPPREVKALFDPLARRQTDAVLLALANGDFSALRAARGLPPGTATSGNRPPMQPGSGSVPTNPPPANANPADPPATPVGGTPPPTSTFNASPSQREAFALQNRKWAMIYEEGAAVVLEPGRGDGGTVFVGSATMPRGRSGGEGRAETAPAEDRQPMPERGSSRGPRPWAADAAPIVPQAVVAAEHYNRVIRMLKKGVPVELEIDIASRYHADDLMSYNVIAEIPGSDLADEIVMLGGHFDSWHAGTGATDNAVGCGVALEAVRILQATGLKPRRTIRIALWTGEEQGLLGSKAYVTEHFGRAIAPPSSGRGERGDRSRERPPTKYELKPAHEKFAAYFNLDNGTGKIRGVYLQGNDAVRPIFRAWLAPFGDLGASTLAQTNTGGTDHLSFDAVGLPGFQFIQDPLEYDSRTHHSSMDVYDRVQADDMQQAAIIMASFVYHTAMRDEKLPRKPLVGEIVKPTEEQAELQTK